MPYIASPTASLTIDRTSLSLSPLVFSGSNGSTYGLMSMALPAMVDRTIYAPAARFLDGLQPVASTWEHTNLPATIILNAATEAALNTARLAVIAALGQFQFNVTVEKNGVSTTYQANRGSLAPAGDVDLVSLRGLYEVHRLVLPVFPVPVEV